MNFYTLPILVNDRREIILQLANHQNHKINQYIIECLPDTPINLIGVASNATLKSFIVNQQDTFFNKAKFDIQLNENTINVSIDLDVQETEIKPIAIVETNNDQATTPVSYEDLDDIVAEKKPKPTKPKPAVSLNFNKDLGIVADILKIQANTINNGDVLITGYLLPGAAQILNKHNTVITVNFEVISGRVTYLHSFLLSLASAEQFVGIALDFGSESSQMAIKKYSTEIAIHDKKPELENLFRNILSYHKRNQIIDNKEVDYYQEEKNTKFYKSIFFLRENLSGDYQNFDKAIYIKDWQDNLKMLVNTFDGFTTLTENNFQQLPNLKITHRYDNNFDNIGFNIHKNGVEINMSLGNVKTKVYNTILRVIIESFLLKEFALDNEAQKKVRFILLIPNIYDHIDIAKTHVVLENIFSDLQATVYEHKLLGWEIITISESDASFLGYINKNDVRIAKGKEYIIIDAGKGTTDFSIIKTGVQNIFNIQPIYRNGFAGAGNMITYSIFETILHFILAHAKDEANAKKFINDRIIKVLKGQDLALKNKLYAEIERLKFNFQTVGEGLRAQWNAAKTGDYTFRNLTDGGADINTLIELLQEIDNITDFYGYVEETCLLIAERAVSNLKLIKDNKPNFDCGGVLLTGRAFMFEPLATAMRRLINTKLNIDDAHIKMLDGNELKEVCIKGVFNNSVRLNAEVIGYPIQVVRKDELQKQVKETKVVKEKTPFSKRFSKSIMSMLFSELNEIEQLQTVISTNNELNLQHLFESQILIGSKRYKVNGHSVYEPDTDTQYTTDIEFTPNGFLVRKKVGEMIKEILPLQEIFDTEEIGKNMIAASLFPNHIDPNYLFSLTNAQLNKGPIMPPPPSMPNNNPKKGPIFF